MKKALIIAAAMSALALSAAGSANAAPIGSQLGGIKAGDSGLQQVHYKRYRHYHGHNGWKKHRRYRHCFIRIGRRVCVWR